MTKPIAAHLGSTTFSRLQSADMTSAPVPYCRTEIAPIIHKNKTGEHKIVLIPKQLIIINTNTKNYMGEHNKIIMVVIIMIIVLMMQMILTILKTHNKRFNIDD